MIATWDWRISGPRGSGGRPIANRPAGFHPAPQGLTNKLKHVPLELRRAGSTREGDYVADVLHAGQVHHHPLQAQTEAGVRGCAVFAEIEIPFIRFFWKRLC